MTDKSIFKELHDIKEMIIDNRNKWKDIKGISKYLNLSISQIRKQVRENKIPYSRINPDDPNSKLIFNTKLVDAYILTGNLKPSKKELTKIEAYL